MKNKDTAQFIPLLFNIKSKKVLIVGGGKAALLKAKGVFRFTKDITIWAPHICAELKAYPFTFIEQVYKEDKLDTYKVVYACTDNKALNQSIGSECERLHILYSICDNPQASSFVSPAIYKEENITISIGTNGGSPLQSIFIRNQIKELISQGVIKTELIK